jgi:hypothetical protein
VVLLINVYTLSLTNLEIRAKHYLLGSEGVGVRGRDFGEREWAGELGVMTQSLYTYMNKAN